MSEPVAVRVSSLALCRTSVTALVWLAFLARSPWLLAAVAGLLAASAAATVKRAPLVLLGDLLLPGADTVLLDVDGMRFAHALGAALAGLCLALALAGSRWAWGATAAFAALKTLSMLGVCPAERFYRCATGGSCCAFLKRPVTR